MSFMFSIKKKWVVGGSPEQPGRTWGLTPHSGFNGMGRGDQRKGTTGMSSFLGIGQGARPLGTGGTPVSPFRPLGTDWAVLPTFCAWDGGVVAGGGFDFDQEISGGADDFLRIFATLCGLLFRWLGG